MLDRLSKMMIFQSIYRILVDLPDAKNRMKILKILLAKENLESDFRFDELANVTEGYSGSDLKVLLSSSDLPSIITKMLLAVVCAVWTHFMPFLQNLCIAAAYRPVHELLEQENKVACSCFLILVLAFLFITK
jgi:hypothetical protein